MQGPQVLSLSTLSWVPTFPELSPLTLPPGVAHIRAEGRCFRCRQFIQQTSLVCVSCPYVLTFRTACGVWTHSTWRWFPGCFPVSSSLSMGTIPKDDQSSLVPSDSDRDPPLNPTVDSDPHDDCCATC